MTNGAKNGSLKAEKKNVLEVLCKSLCGNDHLKMRKNHITFAEDSGLGLINTKIVTTYLQKLKKIPNTTA